MSHCGPREQQNEWGERRRGRNIARLCVEEKGREDATAQDTRGGEKEGKRAVFFWRGFLLPPSLPLSPPVSGGGVCEVESRAEP